MEPKIPSDINAILSSFVGANGDESNLASQFMKIAEYFLYHGYLLVNEKTRIYLRDIEFYYHEEGDGKIKDPIVYHRNRKEGDDLDYYPCGTLNVHQSGIDITFEKGEKGVGGYRASFLIRGYNLFKEDETQLEADYEKRSTYIYEALFMQHTLFEGLSIRWVEAENERYGEEDKIEMTYRVNVCLYDEDEKKMIFKGIHQPTENKLNIQDMRKWRYIRKIGNDSGDNKTINIMRKPIFTNKFYELIDKVNNSNSPLNELTYEETLFVLSYDFSEVQRICPVLVEAEIEENNLMDKKISYSGKYEKRK